MSTFIQIHTLTSHPASLLNRGEEGFAKTIPFGGDTRTRISSQCLKYNWRTYDGPESIRDIDETSMSVRSRQTFYELMARPFIENASRENGEEEWPEADVDYSPTKTYPAELVYPVVRKMQIETTDTSDDFEVEASIEAGKNGNKEHLKTSQVVVLGPAEISFMRSVVGEQLSEIESRAEPARSEEGEGLYSDLEPDFEEEEEMADVVEEVAENSYDTGDITASVDAVAPAGLDAAMFGRMMGDDSDTAQVEGAAHVKHAFTVHPHQRESDYFIAADKFEADGGAHLNSKSLTSGLYYTNVVVDYDGLVRNLSGREDVAKELVRRLIKIIATVTPGAKKSSTAPYSHAEFILVERGETQPRTLGNAFRTALPPESGVEDAQAQLEKYLSGLDKVYDQPEERHVAGPHLSEPVPEAFGTRRSLSEIQDQI
jgi:CRISPR system Cascade subunit CasC